MEEWKSWTERKVKESRAGLAGGLLASDWLATLGVGGKIGSGLSPDKGTGQQNTDSQDSVL